MSRRKTEPLAPRIKNALDELMTMIKAQYPNAQFEIERGADEPEAIYLVTRVDIDETEDVLDLVIDHIIDLQVEERLPIHVMPLRPLESVTAARQSSHLSVAGTSP